MDVFMGWARCFFFNTGVIWFCAGSFFLMALLSVNSPAFDNWPKVVVTLGCLCIIVALIIGCVNLSRTTVCDACGKPMPLDEPYPTCSCRIEIADSSLSNTFSLGGDCFAK